MTKRRLTISLEQSDYEALLLVAEEEERSLSWLIGRALKLYLENQGVAEQLRLLEKLEDDRSRLAPSG